MGGILIGEKTIIGIDVGFNLKCRIRKGGHKSKNQRLVSLFVPPY